MVGNEFSSIVFQKLMVKKPHLPYQFRSWSYHLSIPHPRIVEVVTVVQPGRIKVVPGAGDEELRSHVLIELDLVKYIKVQYST